MSNRLEITIKLAVNKQADRADKDGFEEIYLRSLARNVQDLVGLVGRGKFEVTTTYDRPDEKRRHSERKPKSRRSK